MLGKIYKITCDETNLTYYGSTTYSLSKRLYVHKYDNSTVMNKMECPKIELIEEADFESRKKMLERERWYIENNECINKVIPLRTHKEWYEVNRQEINEKQKEYYEANRQEINEKNKKYKEKNKEQQKEYGKEYYEKNREKLREKITCECGSIICRGEKARHLKTKKHLNFIHQHHQY